MGVDLAGRAWRTLAASVVGTAHAAEGAPCADACGLRALPTAAGELLVAVVADGAGLATRASEGSRLACDAILAEAERFAESGELAAFTRARAQQWLDAARRRLADAASAQSLDLRDYSSTLLVALVDARRAFFFQIGDGAIVCRGEAGEYRAALWPQSGEYANSTWFLTDAEAVERVQTASVEGVHEVALLTDGLQALALRFGTRDVHGPFFEPMFARLREEDGRDGRDLAAELRAFLASPPVNRRTDDDKTLVLATRLGPLREPDPGP
jgi:hypothetical protein